MVSNSVLEYVDDFYGMLKEMWRVCKESGTVFITTEHRMGNLFKIFRLRNKGAITKYRFSRKFFIKTFGAERIEKFKIIHELFGIPTELKS